MSIRVRIITSLGNLNPKPDMRLQCHCSKYRTRPISLEGVSPQQSLGDECQFF